MSLNLQKMIDSMEDLQTQYPSTIKEAAKKWAEIIKTYAMDAMAGDAKPTFTVDLESLFLESMNSQKFLLMLGTNLQLFWTPAIFASATFTGVVAAAPGTTLNASLITAISAISSQTEKKPLKRIATEIHNWTLAITVTLTNIQSGATTPATLL